MTRYESGTNVKHNDRRGAIQGYALPGTKPGTFKQASFKQASRSVTPMARVWFFDTNEIEVVPAAELTYCPPRLMR